jgi:hypothetical protein
LFVQNIVFIFFFASSRELPVLRQYAKTPQKKIRKKIQTEKVRPTEADDSEKFI